MEIWNGPYLAQIAARDKADGRHLSAENAVIKCRFEAAIS
jgi:hypothetical protein